MGTLRHSLPRSGGSLGSMKRCGKRVDEDKLVTVQVSMTMSAPPCLTSTRHQKGKDVLANIALPVLVEKGVRCAVLVARQRGQKERHHLLASMDHRSGIPCTHRAV